PWAVARTRERRARRRRTWPPVPPGVFAEPGRPSIRPRPDPLVKGARPRRRQGLREAHVRPDGRPKRRPGGLEREPRRVPPSSFDDGVLMHAARRAKLIAAGAADDDARSMSPRDSEVAVRATSPDEPAHR